MKSGLITNICCATILIALVSCSSPERPIRLLLGGDMLLGRRIGEVIDRQGVGVLFQNQPFDLHAFDCVIVNMESAVCDDSLKEQGAKPFHFRATPSCMAAIRAQGINVVSLANNHSFDYGEKGLMQTQDYAEKAGIATVGCGKTARRSMAPLVISRGKSRVAVFAFTMLRNPGVMVNGLSIGRVLSLISSYKRSHATTTIVVMPHWGVEGRTRPEAEQVEQAHAMINAGADVVAGAHPHVVQMVERYKKGLIVYSMGNFIFDNNSSGQNKGMLLKLEANASGVLVADTVTFRIYTGNAKRSCF